MVTVRPVAAADAEAIAAIYNEGIEDRVATFETRLRTVDEIAELSPRRCRASSPSRTASCSPSRV